MSRREDILREMGITPLWRLRDAPAIAAPAPTAAAPEPDTAVDEPVKITPVAVPPLAPLGEERRAAILGLEWPELKARVAYCTDCRLHEKRHCTVFGVGDEQADWLFVGEGPGAEEDQQGEPFVGQAGKLLDAMLAAIRLRRGENVYIANTVKCRPPGNRNPEPDEAAACAPYLRRQVELIRPKLIVALGKVAANNLLGREASIASLRGKVHHFAGIPLIVTYHPAYLLRTLPDKARAWEDLCFALDTMETLQKQAAAPS